MKQKQDAQELGRDHTESKTHHGQFTLVEQKKTEETSVKASSKCNTAAKINNSAALIKKEEEFQATCRKYSINTWMDRVKDVSAAIKRSFWKEL